MGEGLLDRMTLSIVTALEIIHLSRFYFIFGWHVIPTEYAPADFPAAKD